MSVKRRWPAALAAGAAALTALVTLSLTAAAAEEPTAAADPAPLAEVWRVDFDGPAGSQPSGDDWIIDTGTGYPGGPPNWGTGEVQTYTADPANLQLDGAGHLKITALRNGDTWTSARIETRRADFAAPEGGLLRIEASLQLPGITGEAGLGYWPAFWTLGADYRGNYWNWPGIGEFDIMENVNGLGQVWGVLHCGVNPGGPCDETNGRGTSTPCDTCGSGFHEYALELDRTGGTEYLRWYLDGREFHSVSSADMDARTWSDATGHGHFILLNLAMGGAFPNGVAGHATPTAATASGGSLLVDHVSVSVSGSGG
ncbi:glycoside hydrolase family 16 protein [Streptomyces litchfieldiae]|uniref:Glycoside hydrolase family 16 protein n=1 Tax=Streptomyces litchfieldiae TaxID=3075543 RepID=A0ABU2MVM7_9ACTN|nr:glycoside hydrolase family 16 protein [Streptomyces sp. DSM 44938]MDT0345541.1 glycoside hydrolase family 16 protein [Streptomyces sp. DSM 44938]